MKKWFKKLDPLNDSIFLGIILSLSITIFSEEIKELNWIKNIRKSVNDTVGHPNAFMFFVIVIILATVLFNFYIKSKNKEPISEKEINLKDKNILLDKLWKRYTERLNSKLAHDELKLELDLKYTKEATDEKFFLDDFEEVPITDFDGFLKQYENKLLRLLILGEPGSGKTTLLLQMALRLIEKAREDEGFPTPIILNLSSWKKDYVTFREWLEENLVYYAGEYGTSKENAKKLANSNKLILLLDGLDEMPEEDMESCLKKLGGYLESLENQKYPELILCCRREEYHAVSNAPVQAAISIEPMKSSRIDNELNAVAKRHGIKNKNPAKYLLEAFETNIALKYMLSSAFHLHIALELAGTKYNFDDIEEKDEIVTAYVDYELKKLEKNYSPYVIERTMGWFAFNMTHRHKGVNFELTHIQRNWLKTKDVAPYIYTFLYGLSFLLLGYTGVVFFNYKLPLLFMFTLGLILGIFHSFILPLNMRTNEIKQISFKNFYKNAYESFVMSLFIITTLSLVFYLLDKLFSISRDYSLFFKFMAIYILLYSVRDLLFSKTKSYPVIKNPYKRLYGPFLFDFLSNSFIFLATSFLANTIDFTTNIPLKIIYILSIGLSISLITSPLLIYISMRLALIYENNNPVNLVRFLNSIAKKTRLMEADGGKWRFRHNLIHAEINHKFNN